jgi:hypothetical protein
MLCSATDKRRQLDDSRPIEKGNLPQRAAYLHLQYSVSLGVWCLLRVREGLTLRILDVRQDIKQNGEFLKQQLSLIICCCMSRVCRVGFPPIQFPTQSVIDFGDDTKQDNMPGKANGSWGRQTLKSLLPGVQSGSSNSVRCAAALNPLRVTPLPCF